MPFWMQNILYFLRDLGGEGIGVLFQVFVLVALFGIWVLGEIKLWLVKKINILLILIGKR